MDDRLMMGHTPNPYETPAITCRVVEALQSEVMRLRGAVTPGHVRDEKGVEYQIAEIGTDVPVTADSAIVMAGDLVYHPEDPAKEMTVVDPIEVAGDWRRLFEILRRGGETISDDDPSPSWVAAWGYFDPECGGEQWIARVSSCYSTREAAEAARRKA